MKAAKAHLSLYENKYTEHLIAQLRHAKRASGEPWVRKFDYDVAYIRTLFAGEGRNQVSTRPGEEYVINRSMHLCNPPFSRREIAQEMARLSTRLKTCLLQLLHCIRIL